MFAAWFGVGKKTLNNLNDKEMQSTHDNRAFSNAHDQLSLQTLEPNIYNFVIDQSEAFLSILQQNNKVNISQPVYLPDTSHDMGMQESMAFARQTQAEPYQAFIETLVKTLVIRILNMRYDEIETLQLHNVRMTLKQFDIFERALNVFAAKYSADANHNLTLSEKCIYKIPNTLQLYCCVLRENIVITKAIENNSM